MSEAEIVNEQPDQLAMAIDSLSGSPFWPAFVQAFKERREEWIRDSRMANVYQSHAELVQVTARVAELDHWIEQIT